MLRYLIAAVAACLLAACTSEPAEDLDRIARDYLLLQLTIGEKEFAATLADNPTAEAFRKLLPLSITMSELNGNEKLFRLPANLPTQESVPSSIQAGDLMLYGPTPWCCSTNRSRRPTATPE